MTYLCETSRKTQFVNWAIECRENDVFCKGLKAYGDAASFQASLTGAILAITEGTTDGKTLRLVDEPLKRIADELGLPEFLVGLMDALFHHLPEDEAPFWMERVLTAIPVGPCGDLEMVLPHFLVKLQEKNARLLEEVGAPDDAIGAVRRALECLYEWEESGEVDTQSTLQAIKDLGPFEGDLGPRSSRDPLTVVTQRVVTSVKHALRAGIQTRRPPITEETAMILMTKVGLSATDSVDLAATVVATATKSDVSYAYKEIADQLLETLRSVPTT